MSMRTGFLFGRQIVTVPNAPEVRFVIPRMITDRIGLHELLLPLNKFFRPCAVKTDAFPASFDKSKGLTSCRRQFPEGCFLLSRAS